MARLERTQKSLQESKHELETLRARLDSAREQEQEDLKATTQQMSNTLDFMLTQMRTLNSLVPNSLNFSMVESDTSTLKARVEGVSLQSLLFVSYTAYFVFSGG